MVRLKAWVIAGNDAIAKDAFVYREKGAGTASYVITGTTLENFLA